MGDEAEFVAETQETLGKLIAKPKMTEKYLKKPPFRFLHDVLMEVIKQTSFGQGLYTPEECDASGLSDKQAKVDFLNKAISLTSFALEEQINVAANKIVAGLDADKTNAWLVKVHQAATTCVGPKSEAAVQRVLSGETVSAPKKEKKKKEEAPPPADSGAAPSGEGGDAAAEAAAEEEKKKKAAEKKRREEKKKKEAEAAAAAEAGAAEDAAAEEAAKKAAAEEEKRKRQEAKKAKEEQKRREEEEAAAAAEEERRFQEEQAQAQAAAAAAASGAQGPEEIAARAEEMFAQDGDAAARGKTERPMTAGRKPPKVKSKVTTKTDEPGMSQGVAPPALIADGAKEEDDDDMFEAPAQAKLIAVKTDDSAQHGKLVRDILEEKKTKEKEDQMRKEKEQEEDKDEAGGGIKMGRLKRKKDQNQAMGQVDIAKLTESIQELCQAVNPLGKSIDLVYQDIANMGKELDHWKQENRDAAELYQRELKNTEDSLVPLYRKIQELDDKIADHKAALGNARSRIAKNDVQIMNQLEAVVVTK